MKKKKKKKRWRKKQTSFYYIARLYNLAHISILGSQGVIVFDCAPGAALLMYRQMFHNNHYLSYESYNYNLIL